MRKLLARQRQFLIYITGGCVSALVDVGIMQLLIAGGTNYIAATSIGFACGLLVNFAFHASLTFQSAATAFIFARYLCVVALNYLITIACVSISMHLIDGPLIGKLASLPVIAVIGFILSKYWIYR